ncbi:hypothetical protein NQ318_002754 [Aromia moschata]|uniref:Peptidase A2 domain-containing protein n=1 Tax=Aromia moschata TaxID=1265417 RepID=A0AAV8Y2R1_9CUCU|nr:hypothetical protein NQ318_002754 [Aromia moschata]
MTDLATALRTRGSVKSKLTNFSKFVKKVQDKDSVDETDLIQLKERLKTLEHVKYEFDEIQGQIEMFADNADLASQYAVRSGFEDEYFAQVALAKKIINDNDDNSSNASSSHNTRKRVDREKSENVGSGEPNQDLTIVQSGRESKSNILSENQNGHHSKVCRRGTCNKCNEKHHTLLHSEPCKSKDSIQNRNDTAEKASEATTTLGKSSVTLSACGSVDYVFLSTAYVQATAPDGSAQIIRALLDCGAQSSFVTKDLIK